MRNPARPPAGTVTPRPIPHPLESKTLGTMLHMIIPPREPLLTPWLREGDSAMIYAPTGAGKSIFTLALALTIAGGGSFLDWKAPKPHKVLFIDGEMPEADIIDRARMLLPSIDGCDPAKARDNLHFLVRQAQHLDSRFSDLTTEAGQEETLRRALDGGFDLLILDNFSTLVECDDENAASSFNGVVRFLMKAKQARLGCILIHHSSKNGGTYRGSSKLATTFEVLLNLTPAGKVLPAGALGINLSWDKYRHKRDDATRNRTVWLTTPEDSTPASWGYEASEEAELRAMIAEALTMQYSTQKALAQKLGIAPSEMSRRAKRAWLVHALITQEDWKSCFTKEGTQDEKPPRKPTGTPDRA